MKLELDKELVAIVNLINSYPDTLSSPKRFASILSDCIPERKALRNALVNAYDEGIISVLENADNDDDIRKIIYQCRKRLENNCGIAAGFANSAILILAYMCGKESWFDIGETCDDNKTKLCFSIKQKVVEYSNGQIEYCLSKNKAIIKNIVISRGDLRQSKTVVVIPEYLDGYEVEGIMPNAFNIIRKEKCRMIILPSSLRFIGGKDNLYSEYREKGVYAKPLLYLSKKPYHMHSDFNPFYDKLLVLGQEDLFIFECNKSRLEVQDFIGLKIYQDENGYWSYPENGQWINKNCLLDYTGNETKVFVEDCRYVGENVFVDAEVEEIIFGENVVLFATNMIHDCSKLKSIVFKATSRCNIGQGAIHHCLELSTISWPMIMNYEKVSMYSHCPKMGDMIVNRRLLTLQADDEIYIVDDDVRRINNMAFASCENLKTIIIPKSVNVIEDNAFFYSNISIIIIEGKDTIWKVQSHNKKHIYVYAVEESNVMNSISPYQPQPLVHIKNIKSIEAFLKQKNTSGLLSYCYANMDKNSDDEMISKEYSWEREIYLRN